MTLRQYLRQHRMTEKRFAILANTSPCRVREWSDGTRDPDIDALMAIEVATGGAVTYADFARERRRPRTHRVDGRRRHHARREAGQGHDDSGGGDVAAVSVAAEGRAAGA
jgi:transcriptional regulator with XRE-family HTH domain